MREIQGRLYRITSGETGLCRVIECNNERELIEYVVEAQKRWIVSNVVELDIMGNTIRTPKVAIKSHPYYKELMKNG
jgi:hypothetical protein